ncbi:hypothetical protein RMCBS344292_01645 [Rhizopus microsporus]|nr:hypothetical protein RMCBS344292_01645 [Rhizopus microsporus]
MLRLKHNVPRACQQITQQPCLQRLIQTRWVSNTIPQTVGQPSKQMEGILKVLSNSKAQNRDGLSNILQDSVEKNKNKVKPEFNFDLHGLGEALNFGPPHQLHINASPNNTIVTLTRPNGLPLITTSGGSAGFKKAARSGYEAAHQASLQLLEKMQAKNLQVAHVHFILKGFGPGREAAFKALATGATWKIKRITDATPIPFGGCRPKKARRL